MTAQDYPVTTPYGQVAGYPLNNGFHNGVDYGCPTGTPVVVNGVTIGLSGSTGYVTGPHLHVGRWVNGQVTDPGVGGGFKFNSAVVTEINQDSTNGKYVRVQGDGASWVYLHMSDNSLVKVGQELKGDNMNDNITDADLDILRILATEIEGWDESDTHVAHKNDGVLLQNLKGAPLRKVIRDMFNNKTSSDYRVNKAKAFTALASQTTPPTELKPGVYKVG